MPTIKKGIARVYGYEEKANKDQINGYPSLDGAGLIPLAEIPDLSGAYLPLLGGTMLGQINLNKLYLNAGGLNSGLQDIEAIGGYLSEINIVDPHFPSGIPVLRFAMPGKIDSIMNNLDFGKRWRDIGAIPAGTQSLLTYLGNGTAITAAFGTGYIYKSRNYGQVIIGDILALWTDKGQCVAGGSLPIKSITNLGNGLVMLTDSAGHVLRSLAWGDNFSTLATIAGNPILYSSAYCGNGVILIGAGDNKIYRSTNYGINWASVQVTTNPITKILYLNDGISFAYDGTNFHFWKSTDYGVTWADIGTIVGAGNSLTTWIYLGMGIVLIFDNAFHLWRSVNSGTTFIDLGTIFGSQYNAVTNCGSGIILIGDNAGGHLAISRNYGENWTDLGTAINKGIRDIAYMGNGVVFALDNVVPQHMWISDVAFKGDSEAAAQISLHEGGPYFSGSWDHNAFIKKTDTGYFRKMMQNEGVVVSGTWAWVAVAAQTNYATVRGSIEGAGVFWNSTRLNFEEYKWANLFLPAGTYSILVYWHRNTDRGILEILHGTTSIGTVDQYGAALGNQVTTFTHTMMTSGTADFRIRANGKNGLATNYAVTFSRLEITKTG